MLIWCLSNLLMHHEYSSVTWLSGFDFDSMFLNSAQKRLQPSWYEMWWLFQQVPGASNGLYPKDPHFISS